MKKLIIQEEERRLELDIEEDHNKGISKIIESIDNSKLVTKVIIVLALLATILGLLVKF